MQGGFRTSRYGSKAEEITAAAKRDGKRSQVELKDPVKPLFTKREEEAEEKVAG